jgi:quercetin dioxygenase-like cupin family protein
MRLVQRIFVFAAAVVLIMVAPDGSSKSAAKDRVVPIEKMQFKEARPGVSKAVLWGDPAKGPYGAITRFTKGTKVGWHTHSHDIKAVVISGTLLYDSGSGEQRLGPGSFVQERSTIKHTTAAGADSDLMIFEEGSGPFDVKMVK